MNNLEHSLSNITGNTNFEAKEELFRIITKQDGNYVMENVWVVLWSTMRGNVSEKIRYARIKTHNVRHAKKCVTKIVKEIVRMFI